MKQGRKICNTLKSIRKEIADANDIKYEPRECHHEGDCAGTCPACEAEVRYLEGELSRRRSMGKKVAVAGVALGMAGLTSCGLIIKNPPADGYLEEDTTQKCTVTDSIPDNIDDYQLMGEPPIPIEDSIKPE